MCCSHFVDGRVQTERACVAIPSDIGVQAALLAAFVGHEAWGLKGWSEWVLPTE